jgi:hypothetical protein
MKKEPLIGLYPLNDCVLVELKQSSKNFSVKEGKYDTRTEGIVVALPVKKKTAHVTLAPMTYGKPEGFHWPDELTG